VDEIVERLIAELRPSLIRAAMRQLAKRERSH
jgi:hypothetical protein